MTADDSSWAVKGGGVQYKAPDTNVLDKRLEQADAPGKHLWTVLATWKVADPEAAMSGRRTELDAENLLVLIGPGCFKCEQPYSRRIAAKPCYGSIEKAMP